MVEYNVEKHLELVKLEQKLKKDKKWLNIKDPSKYSKLSHYSTQATGYLDWSQCNEYLELIKDFVNFRIDALDLIEEEKIQIPEGKTENNLRDAVKSLLLEVEKYS